MWTIILALLLANPAASAEGAPSSPSLVDVVFPAYEAMRAALAKDGFDEARARANALKAQPGCDPTLATVLDQLATATDPAAHHAAFGELSRWLVLHLADDPSAPKVFVYQCSMTPGFQFWLQDKAGISNPYMGTSMPECGVEKSLKAAVKATAGP
jgi:hypothetical protein